MSRSRLDAVPAPLTVAAILTVVEAIVLLGYAVLEIASLTSSRVAVSVTSSLFFTLYGAALLFCAWALIGGRSWARSPVVLAQLIQLGVAWSFRGGDTLLVALALGVVSLVTIAGILHPASLDYLSDEHDEPV
ncbi:hypothetical protein EKO23_22175 [Nocardioides guangzhouensis]|uniref:Integral membrane protein n=1 Tax=Nocardioides guangzhouensis TaxID=2497878 RepID=A0A4Q4Z3L2_9ACTN|nr:hypothetical protein [Nocardioides guangzhouensis]RYP82270.1 hypothetical protein EKO23_22175 [Nocardioides guangzhouensis]